MQPTRRTVLGGAAATLALAWAAPSATAAGTTAACVLDPHADKTDLRGIWIASVTNIDWPSRPGLTPAEQQAELVAYYDLAVANRYNAVASGAVVEVPHRHPGRRPRLRPAGLRRR